MRTITKEYKVFTFQEASRELKDKIIESFSNDIYEHCMVERIDTLKAFAKAIDGTLDYSLTCVPDRREYIKIKPKYDELDFDSLFKLLTKIDDCPLTGMGYDVDLLEHLDSGMCSVDAINHALDKYIDAIHREYESMLTDEYIGELCEANEYEFYESGRMV